MSRLLALALLACASAAQAAPPDLFVGDRTLAPGRALRRRGAEVRWEALREERLVLNLFPDARFEAVRERVEGRRDGFAWFGHLEGRPLLKVVLSVLDQKLSASLATGNGYFQVKPFEDSHAIEEAAGGAHPPGAPPVRASPRPSALHRPQARAQDSGAFIDVLVVYTAAAAAASGGIANLIQAALDSGNGALANSQIKTRFRVVHSQEIVYAETADPTLDLQRLAEPNDGFLDSVHALRNEKFADIVSLWVDQMSGACGIAYLMTQLSGTFESLAFNVVDEECANLPQRYAFAHEIGHNMGAGHERESGSDHQGVFDYSWGYILPLSVPSQNGRTLMANPCNVTTETTDCPTLQYFSNPLVSYQGRPLGKDSGAADSADHTKTLNNTAFVVSNFRVGGGEETTLDSAYGFPTPFDASAGHRFMTFARLIPKSDVRIYTLGGTFVAELDADLTGSALWDVRNEDGGRIPPGTYLVRAEKDGEARTFKVMVFSSP